MGGFKVAVALLAAMLLAGWKKRDSGLCGGNAGICHLKTAGLAGKPLATAVLESDEVFYLEPVFKPDPDTPAPSTHLLLYGGNFSDDYLGCLTCSRSHAESVCNANGHYGSERSPDSIWNPHGDFGSRYSSFSPWSRYVGSPPAIYDLHRVFWGYLTANPSEPNRTRIALLVQLADYGGNDRNTLGAVRNWFCQ